MSTATGSKRIIYYNEKTLKPIPLSPKEDLWVGSLSENLEWRYVDIDEQQNIIIQVATDNNFNNVISFKDIETSLKTLSLSDAGITSDGIYYWRIKALGTQSSQYSDYSKSKKLKIDSSIPTISSVDIVAIDNNIEFHSNMKPAIGNVEYDDGIFISSDEFTGILSIDITYPFDYTEDGVQNRYEKRTYFIEVYFPELSTTENLDIYNHPDIYFEKGLFDVDEISGIQNNITGDQNPNKLNFPKISASLYVHNKDENNDVSQRDFPKTERWNISFAHNGIVIIKIFYFKEDFIYNSYVNYIVPQNDNTTSFHRNWTWDEITIESSKNQNFIFRDGLLANKFIKIGSNLTPPSTYEVESPLNFSGLPKFCFGLGLNATKKLELINNSYYKVNSSTRNSIKKVEPPNSSTLGSNIYTHLSSSYFNNINPGDIFTFLNSHFSYANYPSSPISDLNTFRNFRNSFEIKSVNSSDKRFTLLGIDDYLKYTHQRKPGSETVYAGVINYDSDIDITTITSENVLFSSLPNVANGSNNFGNNGLSNYFVGIKDSSSQYKEYTIINNNAGTVSISGNILSDLDLSDGDTTNFYLSGDTFSVFNNSLFIGQNNLRIYAKTSGNISGIKGVKVIETIPTSNKYSVGRLAPPSNISYVLTKSSDGNISGPITLRYNISSVDENGNEGIASDPIDVVIDDSNYYYVTLEWDNVIDSSSGTNVYAQSYRIYGSAKKEENRTLLSEVPFNHFIGGPTLSIGISKNLEAGSAGGSLIPVSWNDFGDLSIPSSAESLLLAPAGFSSSVASTNGFLADETTYYYQITPFEFDDQFNIIEGTPSSEISQATGDVGDSSAITLSWSSVSGADGYRIYGRSTGSGKSLISTIYRETTTSYVDAGPGFLLKNKLLSGNITFTRASLPVSDSDVKYITATSTRDESLILDSEEDISYIEYTVKDRDNEVVDFYFRVISNAEIESTYNSSSLATSSISRKTLQSKTLYDAVKPNGNLRLFNNEINESEESGITIDYSSFKTDADPLSSIQFSNFKNLSYTNLEPTYSGYKSWKLGFDVNLKVAEIPEDYWVDTTEDTVGTYGTTEDGSNNFYWASIPIVANNSKDNTPISISSIEDYLFDIIGKKVYIYSRSEYSEKLTCLKVLYDNTNNYYVMIVKLKDLQGEVVLDYLKQNLSPNTYLISAVSEFNSDDIESFTGLHAYLENEKGLPYRIISFPNIDFKETFSPEFNTSFIGESGRTQYDITDILQIDSKYVKAYWSGQFFASMTGDYIFSAGINGDVSLYADENVDKYYKYLNLESSKKTSKDIKNEFFNLSYRTWTVDLGDLKQDTYVEHVFKTNNSGTSLVAGNSIRLSRGWHKIKIELTYSITENEDQTNSNAMSLIYNIPVNDKFTLDFPTIDVINGSDYSIDYSFDNGFEFEENSMIGSICMFGILDPLNGDVVSGGSVTSIDDLQGELLDGGAVSIGDKLQRHLILEKNNVDSDFLVSYGDLFDFIQPDVRTLNFSPIKDINNSESPSGLTTGTGKITTDNLSTTITTVGSTGAFSSLSAGYSITSNGETRYIISKTDNNTIIVNKYIDLYNAGVGYSWEYDISNDKILILPENDIPNFRFSGQASSEYRIFRWPMIVKGNSGNKIEFNTPITGEVQAISTDIDNQVTTITYEGIGSGYFQLDFYGQPIVLDVDGDAEILRQALIVDENTIQVNGILPSYSVDENDIDADTGLYPHETLYLSTTDHPVTFRLGDISDILTQGDIFYLNFGRNFSTFSTSHLTKNALPVYAKINDRFKNTKESKINVSLRSSFDPTSDSGKGTLNNSVIEMYVSGLNEGKVRTTTIIGEQSFDANLVEISQGVYESSVYTAGTDFSFWKTLKWTTNTLQNSTDVKFEVRTGSTEEECKNATYNLDALNVQNDPYTVLHWDYPVDSTPTELNIINYTSDGTVDQNNELVKKKFIQFKVTLTTSKINYTPQIKSITITYNTSNKVLLLSKNFELDSNIIRGLITANTEEPQGTGISFGINCADETDFTKYFRIIPDEIFILPENIRDSQFRLGIVLTSSNEDVSKIYSLSFMFETENSQELINLNL